jgi:hypothetical protein
MLHFAGALSAVSMVMRNGREDASDARDDGFYFGEGPRNFMRLDLHAQLTRDLGGGKYSQQGLRAILPVAHHDGMRPAIRFQ